MHRQRTALFREEAGKGNPALVLVHWWCCNHTYFAPQFDLFSHKHPTVGVDLRGLGHGNKPNQNYTMETFAAGVAWLCGELMLEKPVVIGHSMGGIIAFDLACRSPAPPSATVILGAAVVMPGRTRAAAPHLIEDLRGPDYLEVQHQYVPNSLFIPADDEQRKERILENIFSAPQHVMVSALGSICDYDAEAVAGGYSVLTLYFAADEPQPRAGICRFHQLYRQLLYGQTAGSGHFCQLEDPHADKFNDRTLFRRRTTGLSVPEAHLGTAISGIGRVTEQRFKGKEIPCQSMPLWSARCTSST